MGSRSLVLPHAMRSTLHENMLLRQLHITDIGYYPQASLHGVERSEGITEHVLLYCVKGEGWYKVGASTFTLSTNQYIILPSGQAHAYGASKDKPWSIYWIHFGGELSNYYLGSSHEPLDVQPEIHSRITNRINAFEEIFATLKAGYSVDNLSYASSLLHYFLGSLRFIRQYRDASHDEAQDAHSILNMAIHYLEENKEKMVMLQDISEFVGYSVSYLSRLFREHTGHSPLEYFNRMKMQEACYLMDNTDMKIIEISNKLGFNDLCYFSRVFKKVTGFPPRGYRKDPLHGGGGQKSERVLSSFALPSG